MPLPGAFRLRAIHPLQEEDGQCALIYDLERAAVFEVPSELQLYIASALERGDPDETVFSWLISEDLLTSETLGGGSERFSGAGSSWPEIGFAGESAAEGGPFDLVLAYEALTPRVVESLGEPRSRLRVVCTGPTLEAGLWQRVALQQLVTRFGDRLTLQVEPRGRRLREIWEWALGMGVRHLDLVPADPALTASGDEVLRDYRRDLLSVSDDILGGLSNSQAKADEGKLPCDFIPLTRLVRRLRQSEPRGDDPLEAFVPSVWLCRRTGQGGGAGEGMAMEGGSGAFGFDEAETEMAGDAASVPCRFCWARWVCDHSAFVAASLAERNQQAPSRERCGRWRIEAEAAVRFYHQLAQTDPIQASRYFEQLPEEGAPVFGALDDFDISRVPF
jgi:hypothetical protein